MEEIGKNWKFKEINKKNFKWNKELKKWRI
jgi:hypothetical protein